LKSNRTHAGWRRQTAVFLHQQNPFWDEVEDAKNGPRILWTKKEWNTSKTPVEIDLIDEEDQDDEQL